MKSIFSICVIVMLAMMSTINSSPVAAWHLDKKNCGNEHHVLPAIQAKPVYSNVKVPCIHIPITKSLEQPIDIPIHLHAEVPISADIHLPLRLPMRLPISGTVDVPVDTSIGTEVHVPVSVPFDQQVNVRTHHSQKPVTYSASLECMRSCKGSHQVCKDKCASASALPAKK